MEGQPAAALVSPGAIRCILTNTIADHSLLCRATYDATRRGEMLWVPGVQVADLGSCQKVGCYLNVPGGDGLRGNAHCCLQISATTSAYFAKHDVPVQA